MATLSPAVVVYRKLPALSGGDSHKTRELYPAAKEGRCARLTGHSLIIKGDEIVCIDCGATWRDEGF
jgi:hypothetical protein